MMSLIGYLFLGNAILGILIFEYSYWRIRKLRGYSDDIDRRYPAMARGDKHMKRSDYYFGVVTFFTARTILMFLNIAWGLIVGSLIYTGTKVDPKKPLTGLRRKLVSFFTRITAKN
jgi:hypothetical protein